MRKVEEGQEDRKRENRRKEGQEREEGRERKRRRERGRRKSGKEERGEGEEGGLRGSLACNKRKCFHRYHPKFLYVNLGKYRFKTDFTRFKTDFVWHD